jgi:hypothetical protein
MASLCAVAVSGCYILPVANENGSVTHYVAPIPPAPAYPPTPAYPPQSRMATSVGPVASVPAGPIVLAAKLYPSNDVATQTGVISGTVTNQMNGKGRFQFEYRGEIFTGEATVVEGDAKRGVASAYGSSGGHMSCEYQLASARLGAGSCTFFNGAKYRLHLGA